ncbi:MAG: fasciclin domain-containing protein [Myxococcales bacterium]|nr:fasciclin domain-containing protein [Myxococcales bacterium]
MKKLLVVVATLVASFSFAADKKDTKPVEAKKEAPKAAAKDIIDTAVAAGSFKTLATALTEAGLIDTLKGAGPFTVFAPTDDAFAKIAKKDLDALLKDKKKLAAVLTYHVVPGKVMAADVVKMKDGSKVKTVEGREFTLGLKDGKVMVDGANVTKTDIETSNGVIHVIDTVIMPK